MLNLYILSGKTYDDTLYKTVSPVEQTFDGGFIITGSDLDTIPTNLFDIILIKTDCLFSNFTNNNTIILTSGIKETEAEEGMIPASEVSLKRGDLKAGGYFVELRNRKTVTGKGKFVVID